jgi:hypothetical protein
MPLIPPIECAHFILLAEHFPALVFTVVFATVIALLSTELTT